MGLVSNPKDTIKVLIILLQMQHHDSIKLGIFLDTLSEIFTLPWGNLLDIKFHLGNFHPPHQHKNNSVKRRRV